MKRSKRQIENQQFPSFYHTLISSFIKNPPSSKSNEQSFQHNKNTNHNKIINQAQMSIEILNSINSIYTFKAQKKNIIDHSLYSSMLIPQITENKQCVAFVSKMNKKLKKLYEYRINFTSPKKNGKIPYLKWNTYTNYKKTSHSDLGKQTTYDLNNLFCSKAHLSSDDLWKNINKDSIEHDYSYDQSFDLSNRQSISPIKELNEQSPKHILLKKHINNVVINDLKSKKVNRVPLSCFMKKEYSKKVRLFNMLPISKTVNPHNERKNQVVSQTSQLHKHIDQHQNSIMKFLHENLYTEYNDHPTIKPKFDKKDKPLVVLKDPTEFYINLTTANYIDKPFKKNIARHMKKIKRIKFENNKNNTDSKENKITPYHQHKKTEGSNTFIAMLDKYIGVDQSYKKKIIIHKKAYSQQYTSPIQKIIQEKPIMKEEINDKALQANLLQNLMSKDHSIHTKTSSVFISERYITPTQIKRCSKQSISFKKDFDWNKYSGISFHKT